VSQFLTSLADDLKKLVGDAPSGQQPANRPADDSSIEALLNYKPTSVADAVVHLQQLHAALGTVNPDDTATIGKILVAIGGVIEGFFPNWGEEGLFFIDLGEALEQGGGSGKEGPLRLGNTGFVIAWAPWGSKDLFALEASSVTPNPQPAADDLQPDNGAG
jgi:hypothetical protein